MSWWHRLFGVRTEDQIVADMEQEPTIRGARRVLDRADSILERLQVREDQMVDDLARADRQRLERRK